MKHLFRTALLAGVLALACLLSAAASDLDIVDSLTPTNRRGAYTAIFGADILTDESTETRQQVKTYLMDKNEQIILALPLDEMPSEATTAEQVYDTMKTLPLFEKEMHYELVDNSSQTGQKLKTALLILLFVAVCGLSFWAALQWQKYQRRKYDLVHHDHPANQ